MELRELVRKAVDTYNRFHAPEAVAQPIDVSNDRIVVMFVGPFRHTCGVIDWIEDLSYVLKDMGVENVLSEVYELDEGAMVGVFKVFRKPSREQSRGCQPSGS